MLGIGNSVFFRPKDKQIHADNAVKNFHSPGGDHLMLLKVYKQWEETNFSVPWCFENYVRARVKRIVSKHPAVQSGTKQSRTRLRPSTYFPRECHAN